ncbi:glycosyl transferase family 90-domain-containing protein [Pholiota molesta]|nr:glycosyl transferase family 90-domain-containing protein [Pholiota molesta]
MIELLEDVDHLLPPFRAVFSPHDNPNLPTDYELKRQALRAARARTFIDIDHPPEVKLNGWLASCAPHSPARNADINWGGAPHLPPSSKRVKTFIHNHRTSMDPCQHPAHLLLHGQFISHRRGPVPHRVMVPQFSYAPTMLHHDITPAMPINWLHDILPRSDDPEWEERWDARVQWRGSNTGIWHADDIRWDLAQRARLVRWGGDGEQELGVPERNLSVLMPVDESRRVGEPIEVQKALWAPAMADVAFAGEQINCNPEMCKRLDRIFEYRKRQDAGTAGRYKYYIDVDGNGWSSRFKRLITSNALVFKSTVYPEWYTDRVAPWVHYVPIQVDLSDLWDALVFFRGDPAGSGAHEDMGKKIAMDGRKWSKTFWRKEDMVAYNFRLFLEYSRVMSVERNSMSFDPSTSSKWRHAVRLAGKERAHDLHRNAVYLDDEDDEDDDEDE